MRVLLLLCLFTKMTFALSGEISSEEKHWFHFEISNYMAPSYSLMLFETKVLVQEFYGDHNVPMKWCSAPFSLGSYQTLRNELLKIGINDWNKYYVNSEFADGTNFKLVVNINSLSRHIEGSNHYPENFGKLLSLVDTVIEDSGCERSL